MGYLPLDQVATSFLFQLVSQRYTKGPNIVTSNKSYGEWGGVVGDEVAAAAILDRRLHRWTKVNIRGESYRLKDRSCCTRSPAACACGGSGGHRPVHDGPDVQLRALS